MCTEHDRRHDDGVSRRRVLAGGAVTVGAMLAGCTTETGDGTETTTDGTGTESGTTPGSTTVPASEPVDPVPEDARCVVCNMEAANFPEWNAQVSLADGGREYFCSPGCFTAYHAAPGHFQEGRAWDDVAGAWVRDFETTDLTDATTAYFVLETDAERIDAPMGGNPVPFASEDGALAYVEQYDDLTAEDVVGLSAFDVALARTYRARFLPETTTAAVTDPVSVPDDASCAVCGMKPANVPAWNAQLSLEDGSRVHFCTPGCMTTYYAVPDAFDEGVTQADVVGAWVHDFDTRELIDATVASFVLEMDVERVDDPMGKNPLPFASRDTAVSYTARYDDLTDADVVRLSAFDRALAEQYRAKHL